MDSNPIGEVLGLQPKSMAAVRTFEMYLRSREQEKGHGLDEVRPPRLETIYRLVIGEASPSLAIKVDVAGICYRTPPSTSQCSAIHIREQ